MSTFTPLNITSHGDPDGIDLEACYFVEVDSGDFQFLAPEKPAIPVQVDIPFNFTFNKLDWTVTFVHYSNLTRSGHGIWSAVSAKSKGKDPEDPETGTFQAQAGTGTGNDDKLSARASASA